MYLKSTDRIFQTKDAFNKTASISKLSNGFGGNYFAL